MSSSLADLIVAAFIIAGMAAILVYMLVLESRTAHEPDETFEQAAAADDTEPEPEPELPVVAAARPAPMAIGRDAPGRQAGRRSSRQLLP